VFDVLTSGNRSFGVGSCLGRHQRWSMDMTRKDLVPTVKRVE